MPPRPRACCGIPADLSCAATTLVVRESFCGVVRLLWWKGSRGEFSPLSRPKAGNGKVCQLAGCPPIRQRAAQSLRRPALGRVGTGGGLLSWPGPVSV